MQPRGALEEPDLSAIRSPSGILPVAPPSRSSERTVPSLRPATDAEIGSLLRESHALWGAGLTLAHYRSMWFELMNTPWGRKWFRFLVWADDDGTVLSSFKLYRPLVRTSGRDGRASVVGAVFTPRSCRGMGHAAAMLRAAIDEARVRGDALALLFSDIGIRYYAALGFLALPAEDLVGSLDGRAVPAPPGWRLESMEAAHLEEVSRAHDDGRHGRTIAILRDGEHWSFLLTRAASFFLRLDGSDLTRRYRVAMRDGRVEGYLITVEGSGTWLVREVGVLGADRDRAAAILRLGGEQARAAGLRKVRSWMPRELADCVPEWHLRREKRRRAIPMVLPLAAPIDLASLEDPSAAFFPYLDQF